MGGKKVLLKMQEYYYNIKQYRKIIILSVLMFILFFGLIAIIFNPTDLALTSMQEHMNKYTGTDLKPISGWKIYRIIGFVICFFSIFIGFYLLISANLHNIKRK